MIKFYDTNALLYTYNTDINEKFIISNLTLKELQNIKDNPKKDFEIKYKARHLINWLILNKSLYQVEKYQSNWDQDLKKYPILSDNVDSRIILTALKAKKQNPDLIFVTYDLNCLYLAEDIGLKVQHILIQDQDEYTGFKEIICNSDEELINFYSSFNQPEKNIYNLLPNEYIIIKDKDNNLIDVECYLGNGKFKEVPQLPFNSQMFGKTKAKDIYQKIAMDSMNRNHITVVRGPAGSGKSLLSLAFLFEKLEKGKIDKIIIFCNTVATQGSAKLGYYPGSRDEKLLDSQIGNFLTSKIGDNIAIEMLMSKNQLSLLPMSDIRGFDTSGMRAGIYITQAQNMSINLMKLALQRVGEDSIVILDGDSNAQVDLGVYAGNNNGLRRVSKVFRGQQIYGQVTLQNIYRSKIANIAEKM